MAPGWTGTRTYDESVLMVSTGGGAAVGQTLYAATSIVSVRDSTLNTVFTAGTDYTYDAPSRTITAVGGGRMAQVTAEELLPGGAPLLNESHWFHTRQIQVTYDHADASGTWTGPTPTTSAKLTTTLGKLNAGQAVKIVLYGDSISVGASASGYYESGVTPATALPNMPIWFELLLAALRVKYPTATITGVNPSQAGQDSAWGETNVHSLVTALAPDLVIIAFGMNDQSASMAAATYVAHEQAIVNDVRATYPNSEFITIATSMPNPSWSGAKPVRTTYLAALQTFAAQSGVDLCDMTTTHNTLIAAKKFTDQTGNGVNHPSDWLARWQAQQVGALLGLP